MNVVIFLAALMIGLMIAEARRSRLNEKLLREEGAVAPAGDVYPLMAVLYPAAFLLMGIEGAWRAAPGSRLADVMSVADGPSWAAAGVVLFVASKGLKYWAIGALGERWTFKVLVQPGRPLVTTGPYAFVAHPNYIAVVGELVGAAMMLGARITGPLMTAVFGLVLWARLRFETRILREMAPQP